MIKKKKEKNNTKFLDYHSFILNYNIILIKIK